MSFSRKIQCKTPDCGPWPFSCLFSARGEIYGDECAPICDRCATPNEKSKNNNNNNVSTIP